MATIRIAGFDPGLSRTGWGVIEVTGNRLAHIANGVIVTTTTLALGNRLAVLHEAIRAVLIEHEPHSVAGDDQLPLADGDPAVRGQPAADAALGEQGVRRGLVEVAHPGEVRQPPRDRPEAVFLRPILARLPPRQRRPTTTWPSWLARTAS